jgi:hypothetical protein
MSVARANLNERLSAYKQALRSESLIDKAYADTSHNAAARILRNGLAVVGFAIMEDFVKSRTSEAMGRISGSRTKFGELPTALQKAAAIDVFESMKFQLKHMDVSPAEVVRIFQENAVKVASTAGENYTLPSEVFGFAKSNISDSTVEEILQAFLCVRGWEAMQVLGNKLGVGVISLRSAFNIAASRRHDAAHDASAQIQYSQLESFQKEAVAICLCFDALISRAVRLILDRDREHIIEKRRPVSAQTVKIRLIVLVDGKFKEYIPNKSRAESVSASLEDALNKVSPKARLANECIVFRDQQGRPESWLTPFLD